LQPLIWIPHHLFFGTGRYYNRCFNDSLKRPAINPERPFADREAASIDLLTEVYFTGENQLRS
jgi:hypothetical protein